MAQNSWRDRPFGEQSDYVNFTASRFVDLAELLFEVVRVRCMASSFLVPHCGSSVAP
jgi:hypothetical protein